MMLKQGGEQVRDKQHYLDIVSTLEDVTISANTSAYGKEVTVFRQYFTHMADLKDLIEQVFDSEDTVVTTNYIGQVTQEYTIGGNGEHTKILNELSELYSTKNSDYGNSFSLDFEEFGITAGIIPMGNKLRRIKQLANNKNEVKGESIEDSLIDLANYAILTLMELRKQKGTV